MRFYRIGLLVLVWVSLLIIPIMVFTYACYEGLCGGAAAWEIRKNHAYLISMLWYGMWTYPFIAFYALFHSRKKAKRRFSTAILWLPLVCLIPILWAIYKTLQIERLF